MRESKKVKAVLVYLKYDVGISEEKGGYKLCEYSFFAPNWFTLFLWVVIILDMFNVDRMHQRTVICGLIFVVGLWKLMKLIFKWQFSMLTMNKPDRSLGVCQKV